MYKSTEKGLVYYTISDVKSPQYGNTLVIDLENASQDDLKLLHEIAHPFVVKDEIKKKAAE